MKTIKKILVCATLLLSIAAGAQNRSINFEKSKEWKAALKKAAKEKKLIFVDCYTTWCGPCKMLEKKVFTRDSVADFYNANFVNVKYDMENDADGVVLRKKHKVDIFPTMLFIDPATEKLVHSFTGAVPPHTLIERGQQALNPDKSLSSLEQEYKSGKRDHAFLITYLEALRAASKRSQMQAAAIDYIKSQPIDKWPTKENWDVIKAYIDDPLSEQLRYVMTNRRKFYTIAGEKEVTNKLSMAIRMAVRDLVDWNESWGITFDEKYNQEMIDYLQSVNFSSSTSSLIRLYSADCKRKKDYRTILDMTKEVFRLNLMRGGEEWEYFYNNMELIAKVGDSALKADAVRFIDQLLQTSKSKEEAKQIPVVRQKLL